MMGEEKGAGDYRWSADESLVCSTCNGGGGDRIGRCPSCDGTGEVRLKRRGGCDCCGHPEGYCPRCGTEHRPATVEGCEACDSDRERDSDA